MKSRLIALAVSIGFVLLTLSAFASWPGAELETLPANTPQPGGLLVTGLVLAIAGLLLRNRRVSDR